MQRLLLAIVVGSLATACASSGHARIEASALPACMNRPDLTGWHQVSGDGMTFCVPEGWSSTGMRTWKGDSGKIRWAWGARSGSMETRVVSEVVAVRGGAVPAPSPAPPAPMPAAPVPHVYDSRETVGGVQVDLWIERRGDTFATGARWDTGKRMHMTGEALTRSAASMQLDIYRSVRIAP